MVVTRSQADASEQEEIRTSEIRRIEHERFRRISMDPPASPSMPVGDNDGAVAGPSTNIRTPGAPRRRSPTHSLRTTRTTNSTLRIRLADLEAAEKLAEIKRKELALEADLIKRRLAVEVAHIEESESIHEEGQTVEEQQKVDHWLSHTPHLRGEFEEVEEARGEYANEPRQLHYERTNEEPRRATNKTPSAERKNGIAQLAEALEKMARPRPRYNMELPTFTGTPNEWLPFKASMRDTTLFYKITPAENIQRLRNCLKGEARDAVAALLHTTNDPTVVMKTLEQSFGRPEVIIDRALDDLKRLPRLGTSATDLNSFAVKIQNIVCVLQNIDKKGYLYNPMLAREVLERVSPHIKARWCDYAEEQQEAGEPEIIVLSRFLMREADRALRYTYASTSYVTREQNPTARKRKIGAVYTTEDKQHRCPNCNEAHALNQCPQYQALTIEHRWKLVKELGICFKCVDKKHRRLACKAGPCGVRQCRRPHHSTLHDEERLAASSKKEEDTSHEHGHDAAVLSVNSNIKTRAKTVLLKVCPVVVRGPKGEVHTFALLDEGATVTLMDRELANSIGADGPVQPLSLSGVNMSQRERDSKIVDVHLRGKSETAQYRLKARTIENLRLHRQSIPRETLRYKHLRGLEQQVCYDAARPLILIGADNWELIVSRQLRIGQRGQPAASRTMIGWVVHGTVPRSIICRKESVLHIYTPDPQNKYDQRLHEIVEEHFRIDSLGVRHTPLVTVQDKRAMEIVKKTMKKIDGGYEVGLPWRSDHVTMPVNYNAALRRLKGIENKMDKDPIFAKEYIAQIENLLNKGYAVPCDGSEDRSPISWYLPHFAVQNPNKPGKYRLVFDAAHSYGGTSLNEQLLMGPDLLLSLSGIVFRFREKPIAVTADIQEMFLRVKIRREDQPAQQFLWRGTERYDRPKRYKMTSMIFGAASSPFMAHSVRDHNARAHAQTHPLALRAITKSHYMDDLVDSYDTEEEARRTIRELGEVHADAGFTLRGWNSNEKSVLVDVPKELLATSPTQITRPAETKILGLYWNASKDELGFNTAMHRVPDDVRVQNRAPTKREALSAVMSIYDPLGLLSHYTIRAKIILQSLWRLDISWDEPIPQEEAENFRAWLCQLDDISRLHLRRSYALEGHRRVDLIIMCDASEQAYATVAYWRATHQDGSVTLSLIAAKSKVAPRRTLSIPRLELQAAVIGARLADTIKREHRIEITRTIYWTDSATVIHWIRNDSRRYTPYVAHRLGEIAELTNKKEWRWLPTKLNVADDATRLSREPINIDDRWFRGPSFLREPESKWPSQEVFADAEEEVLNVTEHEHWIPEPVRFSKYETLVRTTARVLAFIDICRRRSTRLELRHIEHAERALLRRAQEDSFGEEIERIKAGRRIPKTSRLYRLDPVLEDNLLRVRGRIGASSAPMDFQRPVIMDGRHPITKLIVMREHSAAGHANRERVANDLRQRYWIIHLRPTIRTVEHNCTLCRVRRAIPRPPAMGDLPRARLDPYHRPFTNCGLDYFGPMLVKIGRRREKRWGALFTCLTTRAVHLEIVASLSTDSAIMALRRMAARRGWPRTIYSDNATAFRGADQELKKAYEEWIPALRDVGLQHRMKWLYIPPGAPNQGGAWERLVRSAKTALKVTLHERAPPEEVLHTLFTEAEHSINARPLTYVSVSPHDPEALTPNHFLLGSSMGLPTTGPCQDADRRTWRASQALADHFWRRWVREYLPTLIPRGEPSGAERRIRVGDVVVVIDSTLPRNVWPLGIVERTYDGPDGGIRVADVKTRTGIFKRPVSKLAVLVKEEEAAQATPGGGC